MNDRFVASVTVPGRIESVRPVATFLVELGRRFQVPQAADTLFENAIVEALNNAVEHTEPGSEGLLHCAFELDGGHLSIRVLNEAAHAPVVLTFASQLMGAALDSWQQIPDSGYGLYLMRAVFPDVRPVTRNGRHGIEMQLTF